MKPRWHIRIDPNRPHQSEVRYDDKKLAGVYSVCLCQAGAGHPVVTFKIYGRHCTVDWLGKEESDALSSEPQE